MNLLLFMAVFSVLTVIYFIIGYYASQNIHNLTDYFLAGRNLGIGHVTMTLVATQIGGGLLIGTSEKAYHQGLFGILYTLGMVLGFLFLSLGFAAKLRKLNIATISEVFEYKYQSVYLKYFSSIISTITISGILISQLIAIRLLLSSLGITQEPVVIAFWGFIVIYTMLGGLQAVVLTDIAQVLFILLIFTGIFIYALMTEKSWYSYDQIVNLQQQFLPADFSWWSALPTVLIPALYSLIQQDLAQRFFASKSQRVATLSALFSSIILLIFSCIPIYFGIKARLLNINSLNPLVDLLQVTTHEFIFILAMCGLIAAITSTADSLLCAVSLHITQDFHLMQEPFAHKVWVAKLITGLTGITVLIASYFVPPNIIDILINSYELSVTCLFVSIVVCLFKPIVKKQAAVLSVVGGLIGFIGFHIFPIYAHEWRLLIALGLSLTGYIIGDKVG